mmetsp:Transcript_7129/g.11958  ORF Transcript_7129/g.11958 Transcript_7129/m.11958 type:complete len:157 (+) Transcript_7129:316-786(+)
MSKIIPVMFYAKMFQLIRSFCSNCDFYIFTSVQEELYFKGLEPMQRELAAQNVTMFVDLEYAPSATDDALNAMAHFATADVFIMAKSGFSTVSSFLNPNCVIRFPALSSDASMPEWINLPKVKGATSVMDNIRVYMQYMEKNLPSCLQRIQKVVKH